MIRILHTTLTIRSPWCPCAKCAEGYKPAEHGTDIKTGIETREEADAIIAAQKAKGWQENVHTTDARDWLIVPVDVDITTPEAADAVRALIRMSPKEGEL